MNKKRFLYFIILFFIFVITDNVLLAKGFDFSASDLLGSDESATTTVAKPESTTNTTAISDNKNQTIANASDSVKIKFKTADDKTEALVVKEHSDHESIEVNLDGQAFIMKARMNKPGVRKYKELIGADEKTLIAEVKIKDKGFKLVDENDKLLWKVKISGDKVKISDNEENKNPYVLKKSEDKVKVKDKAEKEIARVKFYPENGKLKLKDNSGKELYISKNYTKLSGAIGVLAITEIPAKLRAVIAAELVKQNF